MTSFDDREKTFEMKFALDEELRFRAKARRNHMLADWAVEKIGLANVEHDLLITDLVYGQTKGGDELVIQKIMNIFLLAGVQTTPDQVQFEMDHLFERAKQQIKSEDERESSDPSIRCD